LKNYITSVPSAAKAAAQAQRGESFDRTKLNDVAELIQKYEKISEMAYILAVPPFDRGGEWHSVGDSLLHSVATGEIHPIVPEYAEIGDAYRGGDHDAFNQHVELATNWLAKEQPNTVRRPSL